MQLFHYPKSQHTRKYAPRVFKHYRSYKRWLQQEFDRVCVYCRQPDSYSPNLNFGVDHYRPKTLPQFAALLCHYPNLYYCCGNCNSRKNADWPVDESKGPYVVNPCDHVMGDHLRFDSSTARIEPRSKWGEHTEELLQLNADEIVEFRRSHLLNVKVIEAQIATLQRDLASLRKRMNKGAMSPADFDQEKVEIEAELADHDRLLRRLSGTVPLKALPKSRLNIQVHP